MPNQPVSDPSDEPTQPPSDAVDHDTPGDGPVFLPVRRRPKFGVFIGIGVLLGLAVAAVVANLPDSKTSDYSTFTAFAYFAVIFGGFGALAGALVALWMDRRSER